MPNTPTLCCDECSACCLSIGHPPFLLELDEGTLRPVAGADSVADYHRLRAAPAVARAAYLAHYETINAPCVWLNEDQKRCQYYEYRPDICRAFEVGGKWCAQFRELHQIE